MSSITEITAKVQAQGEALTAISTSVTGIQGDVTFLKEKIAALENGATPEEIAELSAAVDGISTKIDEIGTTTAALDAETETEG